MEKSFADLLSDAFSETALTSFPDGDMDFESLNFDEDRTVLSQNEITDQEVASPMLETTSTQSDDDEEVYGAKNNEKTLGEVGVSVRRQWQEDYTSSEEEFGENEAEIGEKPGDFFGTVHSREDDEEVSATGRPLTQKDNDETEVRNEEEVESYFGNIPGRSNSMRAVDHSDEEEQKEEDSIQVEYTFEYPETSSDLQDLIGDEYVDKMKDFSGEEHQEAGESISDYPSDFSSCEYVENPARVQESNFETQLDFTADSDSNDEMSVTYMDSDEGLDLSTKPKRKEKEKTVDSFLDKEVVKDYTDENNREPESESNFSNKDKIQLKMTKQDLSVDLSQNQEDNLLQSWTTDDFPKWSISDEDQTTNSYKTDTDFNICWSLDMTIESEKAQTLTSDVHPAEDSSVKSRSEKLVSSSQGSVDDSFFFNNEPEASEVTDEGQLGDDEFEEERTWEQEKERIEAFYKFYNDREGDGEREERQIKVQFRTEALSQVIHYDTDSCDSDSLSSSSDEDEGLDLDYAKASEEPQEAEDVPQMDSTCDSFRTADQGPEMICSPEMTEKETESTNSQTCTRKQKCLSVLKMVLSMSLVVVMGLILFWFVTEAAEWPDFFF